MSWVRLDDEFTTHAKVAGLSDSALRLWLEAACWARKPANIRHAGRIPDALLVSVAQNRYPRAKALKLAAELVAANGGGLYEDGLWIPTENGWQIHNWDSFGVIGQEADSLSGKRSEAGKKGAVARWQNDGLPMAKPRQAPGKTMPPNPILRRSEIPPISSRLPPEGAKNDDSGNQLDLSPEDLASFAPDMPTFEPKTATDPPAATPKEPEKPAKKGKTPKEPAKPKERLKKTRTFFPDGLLPLPRQRVKCAEMRIDCDETFANFRTWHLAKGSAFADWSLAFDTWLSRVPEYSRIRPANGNGGGPKQPNGGFWQPRIAKAGEY